MERYEKQKAKWNIDHMTDKVIACLLALIRWRHKSANAIGGESRGHCHTGGVPESPREEDERDTVHWDGSGRNLQAVDEEWLQKFERMGRRAFPYEHAEREKKEKMMAAKKKKKQTKIKRYMQKTAKKKQGMKI